MQYFINEFYRRMISVRLLCKRELIFLFEYWEMSTIVFKDNFPKSNFLRRSFKIFEVSLMNMENYLRSELKIPDHLHQWVLGFRILDTNEYEFFLRDFPIYQVRIQASRVKSTQKYLAEPNYVLKFRQSQSRFSMVNGIGDDPCEAILLCLEKFVNKGKVFGLVMNKGYTGSPFIK